VSDFREKGSLLLHEIVWEEYCKFHDIEEETQMAYKHMKRYSAPLVIKSIQNKSTTKYTVCLPEWLKSKCAL
jgi:type IV secretory pathway component VirB8